jgi:hypothetical protein
MSLVFEVVIRLESSHTSAKLGHGLLLCALHGQCDVIDLSRLL